MAEQSAEFQVHLADETSGAARSAAEALSRLRGEIEGDTRALAGMQKAMRNLQGGNTQHIAQAQKLKQAIEAKRLSIARAQSSYIALGGTFTQRTSPASRSLQARFAELTKQTQVMPGPMGQLVYVARWAACWWQVRRSPPCC